MKTENKVGQYVFNYFGIIKVLFCDWFGYNRILSYCCMPEMVMVLRMLRIIVLWRSLTNRLNRIKSSYGHIAYVARGNVVRPPARHHITKMKCNIVFLDIVVGVTLPISDHNNGPFLTIILNHLRFFFLPNLISILVYCGIHFVIARFLRVFFSSSGCVMDRLSTHTFLDYFIFSSHLFRFSCFVWDVWIHLYTPKSQ